MKFLRNLLEKQEKHFKEGKLKKFYYLFEAMETFLFSGGKVTTGSSHIRDFIDLKRTMMTVVVALFPAVLMALYNTGYQANLVLEKTAQFVTWQQQLMQTIGVAFNSQSLFSNMLHGALYFLPVYLVTIAVGGFWEALFATIRKHEIAEGFLVTSLLFPLILPPNIPLWQVAVGISFAVVIGKEVFGGVGMNVFNPALIGRAFLFFAYPAQISGDKVWVAVDGYSYATPLAKAAETNIASITSFTWWDSFIGLIPGSMGETSTLAILIGAIILIVSGIGSWKIMLSLTLTMVATSLMFNIIGSSTNPMFALGPHWHLVLGGFAFGTVFMATDPVSASYTEGGKWLYGALIGFLVVMIRVVNPAFPEGMMLAILFGNAAAPVFDKIFINKNIKRRLMKDAVR